MARHPFKNIGIIGRLGSQRVVYTIKRLVRFLEKEKFSILVEEDTAVALSGLNLPTASRQTLGETCDLVIVVGGDGSILSAARAFAQYQVPILGINRGRLGFLADITPEEIEQKVAAVLSGDFIEESRFLLDSEVWRDDEPIGQSSAVNDVVLHPGESIRMMEFELYIDGHFVNSERSDGLIVATPTGSTAYALSAGGPIMHPTLDALVLVPMNPHTLSSRPIVINGNSEISMIIGARNSVVPHVTCDGQNHVVAAPGDMVKIRKKNFRLKLIHPQEHDFFDTCRSKLGWGSHLVDNQ